jgi:hypothetical protein
MFTSDDILDEVPDEVMGINLDKPVMRQFLTDPNIHARSMIWLIENNHVTVEEINERV